jgi:hypothetical protein
VYQAALCPADRTDKNNDLKKESPMFISTARKRLQTAISAATDPAELAALTAQLTKLLDAEGRARGRRQRARARALKAAPPEPLTVDLNETFDFTPSPPAIVTAPTAPPASHAEPEAPEAAEPEKAPARPARPVHGAGFTFTTATALPPVFYDPRLGYYVGVTQDGLVRANFDRNCHVTAEDAEAMSDLKARGHIEFRGGKFYDEKRERERAEAAEMKIWDRVYGR